MEATRSGVPPSSSSAAASSSSSSSPSTTLTDGDDGGEQLEGIGLAGKGDWQLPLELFCHIISFVLLAQEYQSNPHSTPGRDPSKWSSASANILSLARSCRGFYDALSDPYLSLLGDLAPSPTSAEGLALAKHQKKKPNQSGREQNKPRFLIRRPNSKLMSTIGNWLSELFLVPLPILMCEISVQILSENGALKALQATQVNTQKRTKSAKIKHNSNAKLAVIRECPELAKTEVVDMYFSILPLLLLLGLKPDNYNTFVDYVTNNAMKRVALDQSLVATLTAIAPTFHLSLHKTAFFVSVIRDIFEFNNVLPRELDHLCTSSTTTLLAQYPPVRPEFTDEEDELIFVILAPSFDNPMQISVVASQLLLWRAYALVNGKRPRIRVLGFWARLDIPFGRQWMVTPTEDHRKGYRDKMLAVLNAMGVPQEAIQNIPTYEESNSSCEALREELKARKLDEFESYRSDMFIPEFSSGRGGWHSLPFRGSSVFLPFGHVMGDWLHLVRQADAADIESSTNACKTHTYMFYCFLNEQWDTIVSSYYLPAMQRVIKEILSPMPGTTMQTTNPSIPLRGLERSKLCWSVANGSYVRQYNTSTTPTPAPPTSWSDKLACRWPMNLQPPFSADDHLSFGKNWDALVQLAPRFIPRKCIVSASSDNGSDSNEAHSNDTLLLRMGMPVIQHCAFAMCHLHGMIGRLEQAVRNGDPEGVRVELGSFVRMVSELVERWQRRSGSDGGDEDEADEEVVLYHLVRKVACDCLFLLGFEGEEVTKVEFRDHGSSWSHTRTLYRRG